MGLLRSPQILIVVVNYRTPELTLECAESLQETLQEFPGTRLVIVDNGSGEAEVQALLERLGKAERFVEARGRIHLMPLPTNGGFAAGNNAAIRSALASDTPPDYVWLLNSDTIVRPHALARLVDAAEANPRLGIAGSRLEDSDGTPQRSAFRFPTITGEGEVNLQWRLMTRLCAEAVIAPPPPTDDTRVDWVAGASMLIRRAVLEQVGLLDEIFFMYFEDVEYSRRAAEAGWETWYIPASRVEHRVGGSSKVNPTLAVRERMPSYWFDARGHYYSKHHGQVYRGCADAAWLVGYGIRRARQFLQHKPRTDPPNLGRDFFVHAVGGFGK